MLPTPLWVPAALLPILPPYIFHPSFSHPSRATPPIPPTMADLVDSVPKFNEKSSISDESLEKKVDDGVEVSDDAVMAKEVEEFEERLQKDEASDDEYRVQEAYEVALKVRI